MMNCNNYFDMTDQGDSFETWQGLRGPAGTTFTPAVSSAGVISWTNNGGLPNPSPVDIRGPQGPQGEPQTPSDATPLMDGAASAGISTDYARGDHRHPSDYNKAPVIIDTASGAVASFPDGADGLPLHKLTVQIEPVQAGSGDPSPENVRPISGWTGCNISHSGEDTSDPDTITVSWQTEAGTVYYGSFNIKTGVMTVEGGVNVYNGVDYVDVTAPEGGVVKLGKVTEVGRAGPDYYSFYTTNIRIGNFGSSAARILTPQEMSDGGFLCSNMPLCTMFETGDPTTTAQYAVGARLTAAGNVRVHIYARADTGITTVNAMNAKLAEWYAGNTPFAYCFRLKTPFTVQATPGQLFSTLYGVNNIWADCGPVAVEYPADTTLHIQKINAPIRAELDVLSGKVTQNTEDIADLDGELTRQKSAFEAYEQYAEATYAKQDGTYEDLTAGNAYELLSDRGDTNQQPYLFRQTGGDSSAYNREQLRMIVGGTVVRNQLCQAMRATSSEKGLTFTRNDDGSLTVSGTITEAFNYNYVQFTTFMTLKRDGAKYLFLLNKPIPYDWGLGGYGGTISANKSAGMWTNTDGSNWSNALVLRAMVGDTVDISGLKASVIDLTQMFGTAIADYIYSLEQSTAGAGVAFFRSLFPADYYDYNPGELKSVEGVSAHETVGFNLWDGTADSIGKSIAADGSLQNSSNYCVSDYIRVLPNTTYYLKNVALAANARTMYCYGYDKSPITAVGLSGTQNVPASGLVTTVDGTHFVRIVRFASTTEYGINLSDPARNGTYEPYKKRTYPLDDSLTLRGIPKLDSNNRLYYDGDTYEPDGTVTRKYNFLEFDGSSDESWELQSINSSGIANFGISIPNYDHTIPQIAVNTICNRFSRQTSMIGNTTAEGYLFSTVTETLYIRIDRTKADTVSAFRALLSSDPAAFVYMRATPTTETAEPYRELEICDRDGTEEFVSTSIVPVGHETFYPVNVFDYIDRLTEPDADMIADTVIAANKYFSVGNRLFLSTASIAAGAMIIPGTNCTETSLAEALNALNT